MLTDDEPKANTTVAVSFVGERLNFASDSYIPSIVETLLISRQFGSEFKRVWISTSVFELQISRPLPEAVERRLLNRPTIQGLWNQLRNFFDKMDIQQRQHVRHVRLSCNNDTPGHGTSTARTTPADFLRALKGEEIACLFERLSSVHPVMVVEVEIACMSQCQCQQCQVFKKTFTLHQQNRAVVRRTSGPEWICDEGPLSESNTHSLRSHLFFACA